MSTTNPTVPDPATNNVSNTDRGVNTDGGVNPGVSVNPGDSVNPGSTVIPGGNANSGSSVNASGGSGNPPENNDVDDGGVSGASKPVSGVTDGAVSGGSAATTDSNTDAVPDKLPPEEAARKYCRDVLMPEKSKTAVNHDQMGYHAVITQTGKLWNRGSSPIRYGFVAGKWGGTDAQHKKVREALNVWELYGEVHFLQVSDNVEVRVAFDPSPSEGSWSLVGTDSLQGAGEQATMNLGWIDPTSGTATRAEAAVILHEFGHVLGMLHEHQSPAGGGVRMERIDEAIKFYGQREGWDPQTVRQQVIETYNTKDVSSFSQVDRLSIMQYPMPASVTGLPYDIGYNYDLSEMDKAYIAIMYPRATPHPDAPKWTLAYALQQSGISREDPPTAAKITKAATIDKGQVIDPTQIRVLFSDWCTRSHLDNSKRQYSLAPLDTGFHGTAVNLLPDDMCCTNELKTTEGSNVGAHAVIDPAWLPRVDIKDGKREPKDLRRITWAAVPCPKSSLEPGVMISATDYQLDKVRGALERWATCASVEFAEESDVSKADMVITFQSYHWSTGEEILKSSTRHRSYCQPSTYIPNAVKYDAKDPLTWFKSGLPQVKHTICYRAISSTQDEADKLAEQVFQGPGAKVGVKNMDLDFRSVAHEIGHYLGLDHESVGIYGYYIFDRKLDLSGITNDKTLISTKFDTGSIMDQLRVPAVLKKLEGVKDARALVRTVCYLSSYDEANIALLHPGEKLTEDLIMKHGLHIGLSNETINDLQTFAQSFQWGQFRKTYLDALKNQNDYWDKLEGAIAEKIVKTADSIILPPVHGISPGSRSRGTQPPALRDATSADGSEGLLKVIYKQLLEKMGPTGPQILTLQYPTRFLAKDEFQFELSGIYSNFVKPVVVAEAEFRLTDALYDPTAIVSAPNGRSLSTVYHEVINNFVPKYTDADRKVRIERERIRAWLLTEIGDQNPYFKFDYNTSGGGQGQDKNMLRAVNDSLLKKNSFVRRMTRMEFASTLTQDYYNAQEEWELERDKMIAEAIDSKDPIKLTAVTRRLVHITQAKQGLLGMKHADAVVRGYSHIVREALGHLDVAPLAEILQDAKDAFRTSALSSLYGASRVYPVLMSPVDWSAALDTNFAPEDLSENPDLIIMMIKSKSSALDVQKRQLALLQSSTSGDITALKKSVDDLANELNDAEAALSAKYSDSTLELAKIVIAVATDGMSTEIEKVGDVAVKGAIEAAGKTEEDALKELKDLNPLEEASNIVNQVKAVGDAQRKLENATKAWNSKKLALARAEATETKADQALLESSISAITKELSDLNARLDLAKKAREQMIKYAATKATENPNNTTLTIEDLASRKPVPLGGGSRWQDISFTYSKKQTEQRSSTSASSSSERWSVNFWIGSAGGSNESSSASFEATNEEKSIDLELSMKVTLVTVDRSSWFQPQLLDSSTAFMRNNENLSFHDYPDGVDAKATPEVLANSFREDVNKPLTNGGILPAFPVGYIICKDVLIKVSGINTSSSEQKQHVMNRSQSSGGFLCFSYNRASESTSDTSRASFEMASNGMMVRIPGPQILGYVQQIVPADQSTKYVPEDALGKEFYLPPTLSPELSKNSLDTSAGGNASHGIRAPEDSDSKYNDFKFDLTDTSMTVDSSSGTADSKAHAIGSPPPKYSSPAEGSPQKPSDPMRSARAPVVSDDKPTNTEDALPKIVQDMWSNNTAFRDAITAAVDSVKASA